MVVHGICSPSGRKVLAKEQGLKPEELPAVESWFDPADLAAPPASGSSDYQAMAVLPCTMGSLAAIAGGMAVYLLWRFGLGLT